MPALPPSEFITQATAQGFTFSIKPGDRLGVKPPPGGTLTDPIRRYVLSMKAELLALLNVCTIVDTPATYQADGADLPELASSKANFSSRFSPSDLDFYARHFEAVAAGRVVYTWPTHDETGAPFEPVRVAPGVTTECPEKWLSLAFSRFCNYWDMVHGGAITGQRLETARLSLQGLTAEMVGVIEQAKLESYDKVMSPAQLGGVGG
jgi:hypothetical protein